MSVNNVINHLKNEGMVLLPALYETYSEYLEALNNIRYNQFMIDFHIKELLVFYPSIHLIQHQLYTNGTLIFQDKASCMSPLLLEPSLGSVVLDMCAAPGNKTNQLANIVGTKGRVYAVERSKERYLVLSKLMNKYGAQNINCMQRDAMDITGDELADVEYILVDPSCSGSGLTDRVEVAESKPDRLERLSKFQGILLRHALTRFPTAKRVVYSTCSVNPEENEEVVSFALGAVDNFKLVNLQEKLGSNWNHFGSDKYGQIGTSCLYSKPEEDLTIGFFIAVFERIAEQSKKKRKYEDTEEIANNNETNGEENSSKNKKEQNIEKKYKKKKEKSRKDKEDTLEEAVNMEKDDIEVKDKKKKKKRKTSD